MKQALILAGGKGTRLSSRLDGLPKPLIDFNGKPLIWYQIEHLIKYDYKKIIILVGYKADKIISYIDNQQWKIDIECIVEDRPLGTGGAVLSIYDYLNETFLVMYGDTMLDINLFKFEEFHKTQKNNDLTLFVHPNDHPSDSDLVEVDDNRVTDFHSYPHDTKKYYKNLVNAALYIINKSSLSSLKNKETNIYDFAKDIFPNLLQMGYKISAYNSPEYIKDCGTPDRLDKAINDYKSGKITKSNLSFTQQAIFLDRDGTINEHVGHLSKIEQLKLFEEAPKAIKLINNSDYRCILVTNQPVIARGECSFQDLQNIHNKVETILGSYGAYFDRIYFCPHHPDSGFKGEVKDLKIECDCRKPKTGMLDLAKKELNIDFSRSWFIGDTSVDIMTSFNCGTKSILLETVEKGQDKKFDVKPNMIKKNILDAVEYILANKY